MDDPIAIEDNSIFVLFYCENHAYDLIFHARMVIELFALILIYGLLANKYQSQNLFQLLGHKMSLLFELLKSKLCSLKISIHICGLNWSNCSVRKIKPGKQLIEETELSPN
ncbi:hypothetical protein EPI10_028442 [Gossypium australe]|uniref:Uncharacterized protein n=1 Tax=Gossypium australe TaxID=47621 RepID=A0A5B6UX71_9ROSI|nr:hypothetical protein EPI10_028442 [Gossypium australe]